MKKESAEKQTTTVGKRKTARARIYVRPRASDTGTIRVNGRSIKEYFPRETHQRIINQPLEHTNTVGQYDIYCNVLGGGLSGQATAVRHGISRALNKIDRDGYRLTLKRAGFLTRDPREVERKKYGRSGARKRYQYSKR